MKFLLDTHVLLWWLSDDDRLAGSARNVIRDLDQQIIVSVVSLWEIVVKVRVGKLQANIVAIEQAIQQDGFSRLSITPAHLLGLVTLPAYHPDPFDHLLIAQALVEEATLRKSGPGHGTVPGAACWSASRLTEDQHTDC